MNTFGYMVVNGKTVINESQAAIVRYIFKSYINGDSLKILAEKLNSNRVEYKAGLCDWNKNKIHRMITNKVYMGNKIYEAIVDAETFEQVQQLIYSKSTLKNCDRNALLSPDVVPMVCGKCGKSLMRRHDTRWKIHTHYTCTNYECKTLYAIPDKILLNAIKDILMNNQDSQNDRLIHMDSEYSLLNNEIERELQSTDFDGENLKRKIFQCVALQYSILNNPKHESIDLTEINPCSQTFIQEIKRRISSVILADSQQIMLKLSDGKEIGMEINNNESDTKCV